ncbi:MAG: TrkH family potassium uptake protein [Methanobacterium sp.]|nr:TrkH family potassium uptake protein [Methanobacterium sp.]
MIGYLRKKDFYLIFKNLGIVMEGVGVVMLIPLIVTLIYGENNYGGFLISGILSLSIGYIFRRLFNAQVNLRLKHGMLIAGFAWLWAALMGSICLMYSTDVSFLNAYFESMSAWTGSGLSIYLDVEILPKSVLFLRSIEQWVGGLGVVIVVIGILIRPGTTACRLYKAEAREEKIKPSITNTVKIIWWIYLFYTVLGIMIYVLAGMTLFDAINNCFTNLSTGGMSIKNNNIGAYNNNIITIITIILMIIGGTSFLVHYNALKGKFLDVFKDIQFQAMIIILTIFSVLLIIYSHFSSLNAIFYVVSALSCTGSNTLPITTQAGWTDFSKVILAACMIIGMAAGSTTGAIKLIRIVTLVKGIYWEIIKILSPEGSVIPRKIAGKAVQDAEIKEAGNYTFLYLFILFITWLVFMGYGYGGIDSLFEISSAQGNVGLSVGITTHTMPKIPEILLIFGMWVGRIEIIPALVLIKGGFDLFKRFNRSKA